MTIWRGCRCRRREVNPAVPEALSEIIMHLLEKEPDNRYQTAEGLVHDLERLRDTGAGRRRGRRCGSARVMFRCGCCRRRGWWAAMRRSRRWRRRSTEALAGRCRGVLVGGAPGVGKTALVDELRPVVTGRDGWFVAGKFDQYRRDLEFDAVHQAFRGVGPAVAGRAGGRAGRGPRADPARRSGRTRVC